MIPRIICPHCHSPIDPHTLDYATSEKAQFRICPACDEPIVLALTLAIADLPPAPTVNVISHAHTAEKLTQ